MRGTTVGFGMALAVAMLLNAALVVLKESDPAVMAWMRELTGHPWTTHAVLVLATYLVLGFVLSTLRTVPKVSARVLVLSTIGSVVTSCATIVVYYVVHAHP